MKKLYCHFQNDASS